MKKLCFKLLFTYLAALFISTTCFTFSHYQNCTYSRAIDSEPDNDILPEIEEID
mgnify:CR=1 FL=1